MQKPPQKECEQFRELVGDTKIPEVKKYLEKSYHAFCDGHFEAAVVLAWAGIEMFCSLVIENVGKWYFEYHFEQKWKYKPEKNTNPIAFAKLSSHTRLFRSIFNDNKKELKQQGKDAQYQKVLAVEEIEKLRNYYAHGTGQFVSSSEKVLSIILKVNFIYRMETEDEKFENPHEMHKFICEYPLQLKDIGKFLKHFPTDTRWEKLCKKLSDSFISGNFDSFSNLRTFIRFAMEKLDENIQKRVWEDYTKKAMSKFPSIEDKDVVGKINIIQFLPYPDKTVNLTPRDELLKAAFTFLDTSNNHITEGLMANMSPDSSEELHDDQMKIVNLAKQLDRKVPSHLSDEWQPIYRKCIGDFLQ